MKHIQRFTQTGNSIIGYGVAAAAEAGICPVSVHTVMLTAVGLKLALVDIWNAKIYSF